MCTRSPLWQKPPRDMGDRLKKVIEEGTARTSKPVAVYFRADDIAIPDANWQRLMHLFQTHRVPLAAAVVPDWITPDDWRTLFDLGGSTPELWCWHQHGFRHVNHEPAGKKQEFGPSRSPVDIRSDLDAGRHLLESILGDAFTPIFTPPWNRCGAETLAHLKRTGYLAVSRDQGSRPDPPDELPDWYVNVDLHTRKEANAEGACQGLLNDLSKALTQGRVGFMIHHQLMHPAAFDFLDFLLSEIKSGGKFQRINWCDRRSTIRD